MHDFELEHEHDEMSEADRDAIARAIWEQDTVELRTVGIDIGSSTSHLLFARVVLKRQAQSLSSRFVVIDRQIIWRSPIMLTPFLADGTIDAAALDHFVRHAYHDAGLRSGDIDSGAVILTGEAIKQKNARAIDEIFARESGKFVCATAGHKLESILAAHGSGATALSRRRGACALHVDVGGGTTKLALIDKGEIVSVAAFAVGGRLVAQDAAGAWTRVDNSAQLVARELGIATTPDALADAATRRAIAKRLARLAVDQIAGAPLDDLGRALELTEPLARSIAPEFITFSGGVAEYIFGRETADHGDIAKPLADEIIAQLGRAYRSRSSSRASAFARPSSAPRNSPCRSAARPSTCPIRLCCPSTTFPLSIWARIFQPTSMPTRSWRPFRKPPASSTWRPTPASRSHLPSPARPNTRGSPPWRAR